MNISYKELNHIEIPFPSIEEQKSIAEEYEKELEVYKKTIHAENGDRFAVNREYKY